MDLAMYTVDFAHHLHMLVSICSLIEQLHCIILYNETSLLGHIHSGDANFGPKKLRRSSNFCTCYLIKGHFHSGDTFLCLESVPWMEV